MTRIVLAIAGLLTAAVLLSATHPDFSGTWEFNPKKGENVGMMAGMRMTDKIRQDDSSMVIQTHADFMGKESDSKVQYDLSGKPAANDSPMAGPSETVTRWDGDKLVTTWTSRANGTDTKVVRTETRSLSSDGKTMTVELVRAGRDPIALIYEKKQ